VKGFFCGESWQKQGGITAQKQNHRSVYYEDIRGRRTDRSRQVVLKLLDYSCHEWKPFAHSEMLGAV
jgi:hypothetical protein